MYCINNELSKEFKANLLTLIDEMLSKPTLAMFTLICRSRTRKKKTMTTDDQHQTMARPPSGNTFFWPPVLQLFYRPRGSIAQDEWTRSDALNASSEQP